MSIRQAYTYKVIRRIHAQSSVKILGTLLLLEHPAPSDQETSRVHYEMIAGVAILVLADAEGIAPVRYPLVRSIEHC